MLHRSVVFPLFYIGVEGSKYLLEDLGIGRKIILKQFFKK
jgi:hypothetical protein